MAEALRRFRAFCARASVEPLHVDVMPAREHVGASAASVLQAPFARKATLFVAGLSVAASLGMSQVDGSPSADPVLKGDACEAAQVLAEQGSGGRLKYDLFEWNGTQVRLLDHASRRYLAQKAVRDHGLAKFGLDWKDVYGVIVAQSNWMGCGAGPDEELPRLGISGIALQAGAVRYAMTDQFDPVQGAGVIGRAMKEAAAWTEQRLDAASMTPEQRAAALRDGISVYMRGGQASASWNGFNLDQQPERVKEQVLGARWGAMNAEKWEPVLQGQADVAQSSSIFDAAGLRESEEVGAVQEHQRARGG